MAKLNGKKISRKKKKQIKRQTAQQAQQFNIDIKLPFSEVYQAVQKEITKQTKNAQQRQRRADRKTYAQNLGLPDEIISKNRLADKSEASIQYFAEQYKAEQEKLAAAAARKEYRENLAKRKRQVLMSNGFSKEEADELIKNGITIKDAQNKKKKTASKTYKADAFLSVYWYDSTGEHSVTDALSVIQAWNTEQRDIREVRDSLQELNNSQTSDGFVGDYNLLWGAESEIRSYDKEMQKRKYDEVIVCQNQFSVKGFRHMMSSMLGVLIPWRRAEFYQDMEDYTRLHCPELYKAIFTK